MSERATREICTHNLRFLMSVSAMVLFGSRARGDDISSSDIDLLMITTGSRVRHATEGEFSLCFYPMDNLRSRASSGDLFLCHILKEGRALYDPKDEVGALKSAFELRRSYSREIGHGCDLGWLLVRFGEGFPPSSLISRRVAWCVRSILIGRSAEAGDPVFSASALMSLAPIPETLRLISQKNVPATTFEWTRDLERFLKWCGLLDPIPTAQAPEEFATRFEITGNVVGNHFLKCARELDSSHDSRSYE